MIYKNIVCVLFSSATRGVLMMAWTCTGGGHHQYCRALTYMTSTVYTLLTARVTAHVTSPSLSLTASPTTGRDTRERHESKVGLIRTNR